MRKPGEAKTDANRAGFDRQAAELNARQAIRIITQSGTRTKRGGQLRECGGIGTVSDMEPTLGQDPDDEKPVSSKEHRARRERIDRSKTAVNWLVLVFGGLFFCFHAGFVVWNTVHNQDWLLQLVRDHYAALIGLPFVAFGSVCLVLFLDARSEGEIEFKAVGFEFKGASAPIILWALCFLVISVCVKLLWTP